MAIDKAIDSAKEAACRTAEANAIRAKTGSTAQITYDFDNGKGFADAIESIETGITPTGNVELAKQSGNDVTQYASATVRSASVSLNTPTVDANGLITASATVDTSGWIGSAPSSTTKQLSIQAATTITPTESSQTAVESGKYTMGAVTVAAVPSETKTVDLNMASGNQVVNSSSGKWMTSVTVNKPATLLPENIKKDVNIGGVVGTMESGGGGETPASANRNDVTFIDYDGSALYSYSLAEAQALTDLPTLPSHDGLVCQGWNWTLEEIKALNHPVTVGAMYITDDGATRLHIRIATVGRMTVPLYIGQTVANGVSIDWGDGSTAKTLSGTGNVNTSHTYAEPGDYVISLMPKDGCTLSFGAGSSSYCVIGSNVSNGLVYCNMLQEVYVGKNVTSISDYAFKFCYSLASITIPAGVTSIGNNAFYVCYSLASITIPAGVTSIGNNAFYFCSSLASITIPTGVTSIGDYAFKSCSALASITIPAGVTSIGNNAFSNCAALASITIPAGVTSIGNNAFNNCYGMRYYDFSACTAIPTLSDINAFKNIPSDCQMLIPSALYNNWKTATNWATYARYMVSV